MTREEAIKALKWFKEYNEEDYCGGDRIQDKNGDWYYYITEQDFEAFDMAIKALEQEPILDKVNDEIKEWYWQADKQKLAEDPCVVDAMIDLFIRALTSARQKARKHDI